MLNTDFFSCVFSGVLAAIARHAEARPGISMPVQIRAGIQTKLSDSSIKKSEKENVDV